MVSRADALINYYNQLHAANQVLNTKLLDATTKFATQEKQVLNLKFVQQLFKEISSQKEQETRKLFTDLVNFGLNIIFGGRVYLELQLLNDSRGTYYGPILIKDGKEEVLTNSGGGVLDVISFLNRIVAIVNFYPAEQRTIFLDEPFKNLSAEFRERIPELLTALAKELLLIS